MIRAKHPEARIGLFIHSPFPTSEIFRCLPSKVHLSLEKKPNQIHSKLTICILLFRKARNFNWHDWSKPCRISGTKKTTFF